MYKLGVIKAGGDTFQVKKKLHVTTKTRIHRERRKITGANELEVELMRVGQTGRYLHGRTVWDANKVAMHRI